MKRLTTLLAVTTCLLASGMAHSQESITSDLNASLRLGLGLTTEPEAELTFNNYASRISWSGSADAGQGLKAIGFLEFGVDEDNGVNQTRFGWVGVEGDFGTVKGGKQYTAFYDSVTSAVDIAYWGSCYQELACGRQSSVIKYTGSDDADLQFMASTILVENDADNDFIDGLDVGAKLKSGDMTLGVGATLLIGNSAGGFDLGTGFGIGASVSLPLGDANVSASLQLANDNYIGGADDGFTVTGTYAKGQMYALLGIGNADNTPFYATLGYEKPLIENKAFSYFEVSLVDADQNGVDADLQARAVMVFNLDVLSTGN